MKERQREIIYKLQEKKEDDISLEQPYDILIHCVLNTIELRDLVSTYITETINETRASIYSNIEKRVKYYNESEKLYDDLKLQIEGEVNYIKSQRIRKILKLLLQTLDDSYKKDFFTTFFHSRYSNDRKSALDYASYSKENINSPLLNEYLRSGNSKYLRPLLKKKEVEFLAENVQTIWDDELPFYYKKQIIELIVEKHTDKLNFLKKDEYDLYLMALLISNKITPEQVIKHLKKIKMSRRHFAIFNISKSVKFEIIESEIQQYIS